MYLFLGMVEEGLNHLINAITICGQPQQLLQVLRQTLPPNIFQQLIARLPTAAAASPVSKQPCQRIPRIQYFIVTMRFIYRKLPRVSRQFWRRSRMIWNRKQCLAIVGYDL